MERLYHLHNILGVNYSFLEKVNCTPGIWSYRQQTWFLAMLWIMNCLHVPCICIGLTCNIFIIVVQRRIREDTILTVILCEVAICDISVLITSAFDTWCHSVEIVADLSDNVLWTIAQLHPFVWIFQATFISVRNWSMVLLSSSRAIYLAKPFFAEQMFHRRSIFAIFGVISILNFVANSFKFLEVKAIIAFCPDAVRIHLTGTGVLSPMYTWMTTIVSSSTLPAILCLSANIVLFHELAKIRRFDDFRNPRITVESRRTRLTAINSRMIIFLSIMFVSCQIPMLMYGFVSIYIKSRPVFTLTALIGTFVDDFDSSCNFFICFASNSRFRSEVNNIIPLSDVLFRVRRSVLKQKCEMQRWPWKIRRTFTSTIFTTEEKEKTGTTEEYSQKGEIQKE